MRNLAVDGDAVTFRSPADARRYGIEPFFQDLASIDQLDAAGNLSLARELIGRIAGLLDLNAMWQQTEAALKDSNLKVPRVRRPVRSMSGGQREANAIARTAFREQTLLLLDEPTAALDVDESKHTLEAHRAHSGETGSDDRGEPQSPACLREFRIGFS